METLSGEATVQFDFHFPFCLPSPVRYGLEEIKLFSCSTQLSMNFFLPIKVEMPIIVGILTFMGKKNSILGLSEHKKCFNS